MEELQVEVKNNVRAITRTSLSEQQHPNTVLGHFITIFLPNVVKIRQEMYVLFTKDRDKHTLMQLFSPKFNLVKQNKACFKTCSCT